MAASDPDPCIARQPKFITDPTMRGSAGRHPVCCRYTHRTPRATHGSVRVERRPAATQGEAGSRVCVRGFDRVWGRFPKPPTRPDQGRTAARCRPAPALAGEQVGPADRRPVAPCLHVLAAVARRRPSLPAAAGPGSGVQSGVPRSVGRDGSPGRRAERG